MPILQWLDREKHVRAAEAISYRLLEADDALSAGDADTPNMLIQGDNLDALKALLPYYAGRVKCIYIDPPYNTGAAFEHYDDNLEHSEWMAMMFPRLSLLRDLLAEDGFLCCHIDDSEGHYLKVILDEIMGRSNYQSTLYTQVRYAAKTLKTDMAYHKQIEQVLIYRNGRSARPYLPTSSASFEKFTFQVIEKSGGRKIQLGGKEVSIFEIGEYEIIETEGNLDGLKEIWASGSILDGN
jgi:adenine-specific DNA-methyltransferase